MPGIVLRSFPLVILGMTMIITSRVLVFRGVPCRQEFLLPRVPYLEIRVERGTTLCPRDDVERSYACSDIDVPRSAGAPPRHGGLVIGDGSVLYSSLDKEDIREVRT